MQKAKETRVHEFKRVDNARNSDMGYSPKTTLAESLVPHGKTSREGKKQEMFT